MSEKVFHSLDEIKKEYFPNTHFHDWKFNRHVNYRHWKYDVYYCECGARKEVQEVDVLERQP